MKKLTLILAVIIMVVVSACNSNQKENKQSTMENNSVEKTKTEKTQTLSGDYICTQHWDSDLIGKAKISFNNDSVSFSGIGKTTYRIKGDSLFIDMHSYEMGFVIDGNTLKASGAAGNVVYTKNNN